MYVMVVFALALLSPLPFVSSDHIVQDAIAQSSTQNVPLDAPPFEIIPNLTVSPFGSMVNDTNGLDSINGPRKVKTFEMGNSIYAGISPNTIASLNIVNITDLNSPSLVSELDSTITDAAYTIIDGSTYALSTSYFDHSFSIINISNPSLPSLVTYVDDDDANYSLNKPSDITTVTIGESTFALVAAYGDKTIQIIDVTDPSNPIPAYAITDGDGGDTKQLFTMSVTTVTIDSSTFALVATLLDGGIQIINITDPYNPDSASTIANDDDGYTNLNDPSDIATVTINSSTFALVTSPNDNGVQIIDITDPYNPDPVSTINDDMDGYTTLGGAVSVTTVTIDSSTFALVAAFYDGGVQIIDITDPYNPDPISAITNGEDGYTKLRGARFITTVTIDSSTFALVAALDGNGIQIIKLEEYISTYTSNKNTKYAKAGDTLGINFTASDTIASYTSQILGLDVNATVNGAVYHATVTVPSTPRESYATFTIQIANANGESVTVTENDISSIDNIFIDTISPSIELVDSADYTIPYSTLDPFIPNVTVSDGDPNYLGGFTLVKNATVDATIIGSVYNYTYTANPDRSGNAGNSVTRTILVVDDLSSTSCMDPESSYNIITGDNSSKILIGTVGNDLIYGTEGNDIINGLGGNDCIFGNGGNDVIDGGDGDDTIHGGFGHDIIKGGNDNDTLYGGGGKDTINGNAGNDELFGDGNDDTINGNEGNDVIFGGSEHDTINGNEGNDVISGESGHDVIKGGSGKDTINGNAGNDELFGDGNDDTINGNEGNDVIFGGSGHDTINGNEGNDVISGESGRDIITGVNSNDTIVGNNNMTVGDGNNTIIG